MMPESSNIQYSVYYVLALEEAERVQKQQLKKELKQYWKDILLLLQKPPDGSNLHNIARKDYEVKNLIVPENLEDPEQKVRLLSQ